MADQLSLLEKNTAQVHFFSFVALPIELHLRKGSHLLLFRWINQLAP